MNGSAYDGSEYQAYKAGAEYVRGLIEDAPTINPDCSARMVNYSD